MSNSSSSGSPLLSASVIRYKGQNPTTVDTSTSDFYDKQDKSGSSVYSNNGIATSSLSLSSTSGLPTTLSSSSSEGFMMPSSTAALAPSLRKIQHYSSSKGPGFAKFKLLLQLLLLVWLLASALRKFQFTDNDDARFQHMRNHDCTKEGTTTTTDAIKNDLNDMCGLHINQYNKFLWVFIDSLAYDLSTDIRAPFTDHTNTHKIMNHGFKFSTAIYTSFFTGKIPTNYAGHEIYSDNLFYQFKMRMRYVGSNFPALSLLGSGATTYFESIVEVPSEHKILEFLRKEQSNEYLEKAAESSISMFFSTVLYDEKVHRTGRLDPRNQALITDVVPIIRKLKEFIDRHPDYLLILNSDHGGSLTGGVNEGQLHGAPDGGNEAWILFYNPKLTPRSDQNTWIDTVDVCATIAKYFNGLNIPMESVGKVLPSADDVVHSYNIMKSNALQIKRLADLKDFPYDNNLFQTAISDADLPQAIEKMEQFIQSIKQPLINFKRFPTKELVLDGALLFIFQVLLLFYEFRGIRDLLHTLKTDTMATIVPILYLYLDFLFLKFDYFKRFDEIFALYTVAFAVSFYQLLVAYSQEGKLGSTLPHGSDDKVTSKTEIGSKVLMVFWLWFVARLYFNYLDTELPFPQLMTFVILAAQILYHMKYEGYTNSLAEKVHKNLRTEALYLALLFLVLMSELTASVPLMQFIYFVLFLHTLGALVYDPRSLLFPTTLFHFILSTVSARYYLLLILTPSLYLLTQAFKEMPGPGEWELSNESKHSRTLKKILLLTMINFTYESYVIMGGEFNLNVQVRAGNVGLHHVEDVPTLSAFCMAYHKLGYFFILVAYLARVMCFDQQKVSLEYPSLSTTSVTTYLQHQTIGYYMWWFLFLKSVVLLWVFHLAFWLYKDYLTCFMMTMITCAITVGYGAVLLMHNIHTLPVAAVCAKIVNTAKRRLK